MNSLLTSMVLNVGANTEIIHVLEYCKEFSQRDKRKKLTSTPTLFFFFFGERERALVGEMSKQER